MIQYQEEVGVYPLETSRDMRKLTQLNIPRNTPKKRLPALAVRAVLESNERTSWNKVG